MRGRWGEVVEVVGVSAYLLGAGAYLRARGRLRPTQPLVRLAVRGAQVALGRRLGRRRSGALAAIRPVAGHAYVAALPRLLGEPSDAEGHSRLVLLEDGRPLGPAHAPHLQVQEQGGGRYSHWLDHLVFSSSDGSDPRTNGRRYEFLVPEPGND